ncbi:MAG: hypothetical protein WBM07_17240 [Chitinivibrionales bacterium]
MENKKLQYRKKNTLEIFSRNEHIPFLSGRPQREETIGHDDLVDLEIILNTNNTVDELILEL